MMPVSTLTPADLATRIDASETDELARRDDGTDDAIVIRSSIRLGGTGDCAIDFGPMTRKAEWAARKAAAATERERGRIEGEQRCRR